MTGTSTTTSTFTLTNAKYLASKVAADLIQMQMFYGKPSDDEINKYIDEIALLMVNGYLDSVDYGFRKDNKWVVVVSYSAKYGASSSTDDRAGGVFPGADVSTASWGSFLRYSTSYYNLTTEQKMSFNRTLPFTRSTSEEPGYVSGTFITDKNYYSGGNGLERKVFKPN